MKTIKNIQTGEVKRVTDKQAYGSAPDGWKYCAKSEYKKPKADKKTKKK